MPNFAFCPEDHCIFSDKETSDKLSIEINQCIIDCYKKNNVIKEPPEYMQWSYATYDFEKDQKEMAYEQALEGSVWFLSDLLAKAEKENESLSENLIETEKKYLALLKEHSK